MAGLATFPVQFEELYARSIKASSHALEAL